MATGAQPRSMIWVDFTGASWFRVGPIVDCAKGRVRARTSAGDCAVFCEGA